ncbi:MAG: UDP-4-amino-4,6-dideoxy-N-acetyl-beta-L-altrosamine N-acetyltransferase, partial [Trueperaceae bacterium]|nr:UDP-4-amino-4,6-dideoxy-N-acetyl-beta-L-altrosamine N-acetyltransferase [Trueperaceae bacterium]
MTARDRSLILDWRNAPRVRTGMRNDAVVETREHAAFIESVLHDPTKKYLVYEDDKGKPQGLVNFVRIDTDTRSAEWGIYVGEQKSNGIGTAMAVAALDLAFDDLGLQRVEAEVLGVNPRSLRFHAKLGFRTTRIDIDAYFRGDRHYDVHHLVMDMDAWNSSREQLIAGEPTPSERRPIVIASTKNWNHILVPRVARETGRIVHWIERRDELTKESLDQLAPDYIFLPHWSFIIPETVYDAFETVVFHMTDLPFGRGGSPLQNLIARGIYETKITSLRCNQELDAGDIYLKTPLCLHGNAEDIYLRARDAIGRHIIEITTATPTPTPQTGEATLFKRRTPAQSE